MQVSWTSLSYFPYHLYMYIYIHINLYILLIFKASLHLLFIICIFYYSFWIIMINDNVCINWIDQKFECFEVYFKSLYLIISLVFFLFLLSHINYCTVWNDLKWLFIEIYFLKKKIIILIMWLLRLNVRQNSMIIFLFKNILFKINHF